MQIVNGAFCRSFRRHSHRRITIAISSILFNSSNTCSILQHVTKLVLWTSCCRICATVLEQGRPILWDWNLHLLFLQQLLDRQNPTAWDSAVECLSLSHGSFCLQMDRSSVRWCRVDRCLLVHVILVALLVFLCKTVLLRQAHAWQNDALFVGVQSTVSWYQTADHAQPRCVDGTTTRRLASVRRLSGEDVMEMTTVFGLAGSANVAVKVHSYIYYLFMHSFM